MADDHPFDLLVILRDVFHHVAHVALDLADDDIADPSSLQFDDQQGFAVMADGQYIDGASVTYNTDLLIVNAYDWLA